MRTRVGMGRSAGIVGLTLTIVLGLAAGCGGGNDGGDDESAGATSTTAAGGAGGDLLILLTSADGLLAPGLDALAQNLYTQPGIEVTVAAPAAVDPAAPVAPAGEAPASNFGPTAGGYPGVEIQADPATTVGAALGGGVDGVTDGAQLVVVGVNEGQLLGPLGGLDGDVAAAQAAAAAGIPALVVAAGSDEVPPDNLAAIDQVKTWVEEHRDALLAGTAPANVTMLNVPGCGFGTVRGVVEVPIATDAAGRDGSVVDCASTAEDPADDIAAFTTGYATLSVVTTPPASAPTTIPSGAPPVTVTTVAPG